MIYPLSKLVKIMYGKNQKEVLDVNGKYPIYGTGGLIAYSNKYLYDKPSVLIGRKGTINKVKYVEKPFWTVDTLFYTIINEEYVLPKYLYYKMLTLNLDYYNEGTTIPSLRKETLYRIELDIPSIITQKKCIKILGDIDKKIKLNEEINNNLFNLIKNNYLKMQENMSELENVKLKDIADISSGKRPKNKGVEYSIPLVGASGIMSYTEEYNSDSDILVIGRVGTLGVVQRYFEKIWLSDNTLTIKTIYSNVLENYLNYVDYQSLNRGSTQPLITQKDISNLYIKFNEKEFNKFEDEVTNLRKKIELNNKQNKILEQLRDTLLPKLMNGEIDLDNIEI